MATGRSVPARSGRWMSAWRASGMFRGSMTTSLAPRARASLMIGTMWIEVADGLQPQMTISLEST
jgi:hypothetical protein